MWDLFLKSKRMRVRVAAVIQNEKNEILLIKQKKKNNIYWLLPGGGIEFGESADAALKRELHEELSLNCIESKFLLLSESIDPKGKRHIIQIIFQAKVDSHFPIIPESEKAVLDFAYVPINEVQNIELRPNIKSYFKSGNDNLFIKTDWVIE